MALICGLLAAAAAADLVGLSGLGSGEDRPGKGCRRPPGKAGDSGEPLSGGSDGPVGESLKLRVAPRQVQQILGAASATGVGSG